MGYNTASKKTSSAKQGDGLISTRLFSCLKKSQEMFGNNTKIKRKIFVIISKLIKKKTRVEYFTFQYRKLSEAVYVCTLIV